MSRYHDAIVSGIVFSFVVGLVALAELTKNNTTPNETVTPVVAAQNSSKGFSLAQVLVEQEVVNLSKGHINGQHEDQVRSQVATLSKSDLKLLKAKTRNLSNSWEERYASAYLLNIAGVKTVLPERPALKAPDRAVASVSKARMVKKPAVKEFARGKVPTKQTKFAKRNPDLLKKSVVKTSKRLTGQVASREIAVAKR
ncbi:hypothetical protein B9G69_010910 [Bdellovibrio sp. SKB1291214]|uniref:hypothetical protein n=1 Tax=Bdellovibrio sp. SKB1291214 TaxID=1732569 RepID=UPI000B519628|nr:hypothetical protein [Bdellovibrio sp. SKB1291214]UYL07554.1 hypothetical protein B9G69_010910 [Bdellovibrio sp. SKB1291214]